VALAIRADSTIGRASVERFASEGAYVHAAEGEPDRDGAIVRDCLDRFGGLDVLVIPSPDAPVEPFPGTSIDDHRGAIDAGLRTTYFVAQHAVRAMRDGGRICVAAPRRPERIPAWMPPPATIVEGGLIALVRLLAVELAPQGIAVNSLCPIGSRAEAGAVAAGLAFSASDDASYVSGAFIAISS
jgi:NAD(P)-dependent dehydrogenase (short-subunit alcohol dehydrogenase family)